MSRTIPIDRRSPARVASEKGDAAPSGWAAVPVANWLDLFEQFPRPVCPDAAFVDLRIAQSRAVAPGSRYRFPSLSMLCDRWGWKLGAVRGFVASEVWSDPELSGDRLARWKAIRDARIGIDEQATSTARAGDEHSTSTNGTVEATVSARDEHSASMASARDEHATNYTRVGTQSTEHRAQEEERAGLSPRTPLSVEPTPPDSLLPLPHPEAAPAAIAHPEVVTTAASGSPRRKRSKATAEPTSAERDAWEACRAAWGEKHPGKAAALTMGEGYGLALMEAIRANGARVMVDRLRLLVRDPSHAWRLAGQADGKPQALSVFLRGRNGHTVALDGEAVERRATGDAAILDRETGATAATRKATLPTEAPAAGTPDDLWRYMRQAIYTYRTDPPGKRRVPDAVHPDPATSAAMVAAWETLGGWAASWDYGQTDEIREPWTRAMAAQLVAK